MKELSIEKKAKRYDEALEKARKLCTYPTSKPFISDLQELFPELKESEESDGEKIRKHLITLFINDYGKNSNARFAGIKVKDIIAWLEKQSEKKESLCDKCRKQQPSHSCQDITALGRCALEKQGEQKPYSQMEKCLNCQFIFTGYCGGTCILKHNEQKPIDKIEPKFHEGDFIKHNKANIICKVISVNRGSYYLENIETSCRIEFFYAEQNFHLWTIQDAKDGDVLCVNNEVFIYEHKKQMYSIAVAHCFVDSAGGFYLGGEFVYREYGKTICPATKEQRDLLFQKMKEAGYGWDTDKKELKSCKL